MYFKAMAQASEISKKLIELTPLMMQQIKPYIRKASEGRLTHPQYRVLANIYRGLNSVTEIASHHGVSQPTMTKTIGIMVTKGWIRKESRLNDSRQIHLALTKKGAALFLDVRKVAQKRMAGKIAKLSIKEMQKLDEAIEIFQKIIRTWQKEQAEKP